MPETKDLVRDSGLVQPADFLVNLPGSVAPMTMQEQAATFQRDPNFLDAVQQLGQRLGLSRIPMTYGPGHVEAFTIGPPPSAQPAPSPPATPVLPRLTTTAPAPVTAPPTTAEARKADPAAPSLTAETPLSAPVILQSQIQVGPKDTMADAMRKVFDLVEQQQERFNAEFREYETREQGVATKEQEALTAKSAAIHPTIDLLKKIASRDLPKLVLQGEPSPPSTEQRPFLSAEGKTALQTLVAGMGQVVMAIGGMTGGSPIAAMHALTGAMDGWKQGDVDRISREWKTYEAEVAKVNRDNSRAQELWNAAMVQRADDLEAARVYGTALMMDADLKDYGRLLATEGLQRTGQKMKMIESMMSHMLLPVQKAVNEELALMRFKDSHEGHQWMNQLRQLQINAALQRPDQDAMNFLVDQYLAGDTSAKQNIGRGIQGPAIISQFVNTLKQRAGEKGLTPSDVATNIAEFSALKAGERTLATREANIDTALVEADQLIPLMEATAAKVPKTDWPLVNKALRVWNLNVPMNPEHSAAWQQHEVAVNSFIGVYARAMKGAGVPDVTSMEHARQLISTTQNTAQFAATVKQLRTEMQAALSSPGIVREKLRKEFGTRERSEAPPEPAPPQTPTRSLDDLLKQYAPD